MRVGGQKVKNSWLLGHPVATTKSGLPIWIPNVHRVQILRGNVQVIRFWTSICGLYRVLDYFGSLKLSTIYKPGIPYKEQPYLEFLPTFFDALISIGGELPKISEWKPVLIGKSGPGVLSKTQSEKVGIKAPSSTTALAFQAIVWASDQFVELFEAFKQVATLTGQDSLVSKLRTVAD